MKAKPFIVVVMCLFMLMLFAGGMISETDLTPDTPPATVAVFDDIRPLRVPAGRSGSACYSPYIVQRGDTLSKIALACGVNLNELLAANPGLTNPNLIYANQELRIPFAAQPGANPLADAAATAAVEQQAAAAGVLTTGSQTAVVSAPAASAAASAAPPALAEAAAPTPVSAAPTAAPAATAQPAAPEIPGPRVGEQQVVEITGLPAQTEFSLKYGTSGGRLFDLTGASSDSAGVLRLTINIPPEARPGELWMVFAFDRRQPTRLYQSNTFQIGGAP
jgi:hypothetical protein